MGIAVCTSLAVCKSLHMFEELPTPHALLDIKIMTAATHYVCRHAVYVRICFTLLFFFYMYVAVIHAIASIIDPAPLSQRWTQNMSD